MKLFWIAAITAGALTLSSGQTPATVNSGQTDTDSSVLNGTDVVAELSKSVNAKNVKPGDVVKATVTQDVLAHGRIVIRRGSKLIGHVTEAKTRSKDDQESRLGLVFDKALLKGGKEIDFTAAVRALAPGVRISAVDQPDQMAPPLRGPIVQSNTPQPMSSGSSAASGSRGLPGGGSSTTSTVTPKDTMDNSEANRAALYSRAARGNNPETDLMGAGTRGVFGLPDLRLSREPGGGRGSVISSTRHNVRLDSGTQMVLQIASPPSQ